MKRPRVAVAAIALCVAHPFAVFADHPTLIDESGVHVCAVWCSGPSTKDFVDIDTPHMTTHPHALLLFVRDRVFLAASVKGGRGGAIPADELAGSEIDYQIGNGAPDALTLPLVWQPFRELWHDRDAHGDAGDLFDTGIVLFDISGMALGLALLQHGEAPPTVTLKHPAVIDQGFNIDAPTLRYRVGVVTTTITFDHFAASRAYCERANRTGLGGWFK